MLIELLRPLVKVLRDRVADSRQLGELPLDMRGGVSHQLGQPAERERQIAPFRPWEHEHHEHLPGRAGPRSKYDGVLGQRLPPWKTGGR